MLYIAVSNPVAAEPYMPQNEFEVLNSVMCDGIQKDKEVGVSSVVFDNMEELVWIGTKCGRVRIIVNG